MKKTIILAVLALASFNAAAQGDDYQAKVQENMRYGAYASSVAYGKATAVVKVVEKDGKKVAVLQRANSNPDFNAEVLRAANKVLDESVEVGTQFLVTSK